MAKVTDQALEVNRRVTIPLGEVQLRTSTPGGPGGQHANRTQSKVIAELDLETCSGFGPQQRARVIAKLGPTVTVSSAESRSQAQNRQLVLERLAAKLEQALVIEAPRRPTKPSKASKVRRVEAKARRGAIKQHRRKPTTED